MEGTIQLNYKQWWKMNCLVGFREPLDFLLTHVFLTHSLAPKTSYIPTGEELHVT